MVAAFLQDVHLEKSTGKIRCKKKEGTLFLIAPNLALTSKHVFIGHPKNELCEVEFPSLTKGKKFSAKNIASHKSEDISVIQIYDNFKSEIYLPVNIATPIKDVYWRSFGYPGQRDISGKYVQGKVSLSKGSDEPWDIELGFELAGSLQDYSGYSGGPIIVNNFVVGLMKAQEDNTLTAVSCKKFKRLLEEQGISYVEQELPSWMHRLVDEAVENAGPRYTKEIHVDLPISRHFEALGKSKNFAGIVKKKYLEVLKYTKIVNRHEVPKCQNLSNALHEFKNILFSSLDNLDKKILDNKSLDLLHQAINLSKEIPQEISSLPNTQNGAKSNESNVKSYHEIESQLLRFKSFLESDFVLLADRPALLINGEAGEGKTHLLCDIASQRIQNNQPTLLLLGETFDGKGEIWSQIIKQIGLNQSKEDFIRHLEMLAEKTGNRVLILIDALNEEDSKTLWKRNLPGFLKSISNSDLLGVGLSVRTTYESSVLPSSLIKDGKLIKMSHTGFTGFESRAAQKFFLHYGIALPRIPLLTPEFSNPLFLKLFCEGLNRSNLTSIPHGLQGITAVLEFFISTVNNKLASVEQLDYDEDENIVHKAVYGLAKKLADSKTNWLPVDEGKSLLNNYLPNRTGHSKSLFRALISEGVIVKNKHYDYDTNEWIEGVRFSYERFTDHLITSYLVSKVPSSDLLSQSFKKNGVMYDYTKDLSSLYRYQGIVEALSVQLPEKFQKELHELVKPSLSAAPPVFSSYFNSLIWRKSTSINASKFEKYTDKHVSHLPDYHALWSCILTLAVSPDHPLNAEYLHENMLYGLSLVERDLLWSNYLHEQHGDESSIVNRIIEWAWSDQDKSHISEDSLRLTGVALTWMFTTSNRFIRDKATKALVCLASIRIEIVKDLLNLFYGVNDPYVYERLLGAAYGAFMRVENDYELNLASEILYKNIFLDKNSSSHVLERDYARGILELALFRNCVGQDINMNLVRPPYKSQFPQQIPTKADLEARYYIKNASPTSADDIGQNDIWLSVMSFGDFARYVIGTNSNRSYWSTEPLTNLLLKEQLEFFVSKLTARQKSAFDLYSWACAFLSKSPQERGKLISAFELSMVSDELLVPMIQSLKQAFLQTLNKQKREAYKDEFEACFANSRSFQRFNLDLVQRWVFSRVFELGWRKEYFGEFDRFVNYFDGSGRESAKAERVGKKYQWIAFHEITGVIADNFVYLGRGKSTPHGNVFQGPWQDLSLRDIDPTVTFKEVKSLDTYDNVEPVWWNTLSLDEPSEDLNAYDWIRKSDDIPSIRGMLEARNNLNGTEWYSLENYFRWQYPEHDELNEDRYPNLVIKYSLQAYIIKKNKVGSLIKWLKKELLESNEDPLPKNSTSSTLTDSFLGEYFWSPAFKYHDDPYYGRSGWESVGDNKTIKLLPATDGYFHESSNRDCSFDFGFSIDLPSRWLVDELNLKWMGKEGCYHNSQNEVVIYDPSITERGPHAVLLNKYLTSKYFKESPYTLFWLMTGEKVIHGDPFTSDINNYGRLLVDQIAYLKDGTVQYEKLQTRLDDSW